MAKNLIEYNAYDADVVPYSGYNSNKTVLGPQIYKFTGSSSANYYIGPNETTFRDITQDTNTNHWGDIAVVPYNGNTDWLFALRYGANNGGGQSATDICMYEFNKLTYTYTYVGAVTCANANASTASLHWGFNTDLTYYTAGTVQVSGTSVVGTSTDWILNRIPIGTRIGFGSNNPADITTWYRISNYPLMNSTPSLINGTVTCIAFDTSGNTFIGGTFTTYSGVSVGRITKISSGGTLDTTFNTNIGAGLNQAPYVIRVDTSGRLYVGGVFTTYSGLANNYIIKLNNNGTKDTSFDNTTGFNNGVFDIQFDSVGKLYVCGTYTLYKGVTANRIIKLNTDGSKDTSFDNTTGFDNNAFTIAVAENNSVYVGGNFTTYKSAANPTIIKILSGGTKDTTFDNTTGFGGGGPHKILYKSSTNSIIVGGPFSSYKSVSNSNLTEISSIGTVILSSRSTVTIYGMDIDSSNNLYSYGINQIVIKRNINTLVADINFNPNVVFTTYGTSFNAIAVDPTGTRLYVGSSSNTVDSGLVCVNTSDGEKVSNFITFAQNLTSQVITLNSFAGTFPAGTPYVIENLLFSEVHQSVSVCLIQGLSKDDFTSTPTSIPTPAFNYAGLAKGKYMIYDGFYTLANGSTAVGISASAKDTKILPPENSSTQYMYVTNSAGRVARFNIKNPNITQLGSGTQGILRYSKSSQLFLTGVPIITPTGAAVNGTTVGKLAIGTMQSGTASGITSLFTDSTGIVQTPISGLTNEDVPLYTIMPEVPPGSTTTYAAAGNVGRVIFSPTIDKLIVLNASSTAKSYITKYQTNMIQPTLVSSLYGRETFANLSYNNSYDTTFLFNGGQLQGNTSNILAPKYPDTLGIGFFGLVLDSTLHLCRAPLATIQNNLYAVPMGCEALYVDYSNNVFITPKYTLPNVITITGLLINSQKQYGSYPFAIPPEPIVIHYRTTGITANTGTWTEFTDVQSLNDDIICDGVLNSIDIQFRFSYKVAGNTCLTNKIYGFSLAYEDDRTDSHYSPSVSKSSLSSRTFAWRQEQLWNSNIPDLRIRLYNANNSNIVFYDTVSTSASGTWEYSTDNGVTWLPWSSSADAVGNYIRYVADFIPVGIKLRVGLNRI